MTRRAAAAAGALVALLAGCSGGGTGPAPTTDELSPMGEYYAQVGGDFTQDDADAANRRYQDLLAQCMAEQGFEYTSAMPPQPPADSPLYDSVEYAQQWGYGTSTSDDTPAAQAYREWVDPNRAVVDAMSDAERAAYDEAMSGSPDDAAGDGFAIGGCMGTASTQAFDRDPEWDDAFEGMFDELAAELAAKDDDPRLTAAAAAWSSCMAGAGYDVARPPEAAQSITDAYNELSSRGELAGEPLAQLRQREIDTAVADRTCLAQVGYRDVEREARFDVERRFVDAHRAELDAWVAAYEATR